MDAPRIGERGSWRVGLFSEFERDPLQIYEQGEAPTAIVSRRQWSELGISGDVARPLTLRLRLPVVAQWGSGSPSLSGDGTGAGDVSVGGVAVFARADKATWRGAGGLRADLSLPTSRDAAWSGEGSPVFEGGLLGMMGAGPTELLVDVGLRLRKDVAVTTGWTQGSQWSIATGLRLGLVPDHLSAHVAITALGAAHRGATGAAAVEATTGLQGWLGEHLQVDLGAGTGMSQAVGTTAFRLFGALTWLQPADPRAAPVVQQEAPAVRPDAPDESVVLVDREDPPPPPAPPAAPVWTKDQLARLAVDRIETIRPLEFSVGTNRLERSAQSTVDQVAAILNEDGRLLHVVIEGHASSDGDVAVNYDLSLKRAIAVYNALVAAGVHPDRLSVRGKGEIRAAGEVSDPEHERRVDFLLVRTRLPGEPTEAAAGEAAVPWTGDLATFPSPPLPAEEAP